MASGKTSNYNLSQWEQSDRILMEDFNGDNAKIDSALKTITESFPYRKILTVTTQTAAQQIDVTVSQIDFSQYHKIELFVDCPSLTGGFLVRVNGDGGNTYNYLGIEGGGSDTAYTNYLAVYRDYCYGIMLFYTPVAAGRVGCLSTAATPNSYTGHQILAASTWGALTAFNFISSQMFPAGTKIQIFGVKK